MILFRSLYCLVLLAPVCLAAGDADAVNERIPVTALEMEAHWQVDCAGSWGQLTQRIATFQSQGDCDMPAALLRQLQLCAFIYQPPGRAVVAACPDYRGAYGAAGQGKCATIAVLLESAPPCLH